MLFRSASVSPELLFILVLQCGLIDPCLYGLNGGGRLDDLLSWGVKRSDLPSRCLGGGLLGFCIGACAISGGIHIVSLWCGTTVFLIVGVGVSSRSEGRGDASSAIGPEYGCAARRDLLVVSINWGLNRGEDVSLRGVRCVGDCGGCAIADSSGLVVVVSSCACAISSPLSCVVVLDCDSSDCSVLMYVIGVRLAVSRGWGS